MKSVLGIYGSGGFGREVMPVAVTYGNVKDRHKDSINLEECLFLETEPLADSVNNVKVMSEKSYFDIVDKKLYFTVAIANSKVREAISTRMITAGVEPCTIQDNTAIVHVSSNIDVGAIFSHYSIVTANSIIGKFFHANYMSYVAHDCKIGDYVTFAPGASCSGNVHIGNHTYVGANATIKQGSFKNPLHIGANVLVGMGSIVTKDLPDNVIVAGNPARIIGSN